MKIAVRANQDQKMQLLNKKTADDTNIIWLDNKTYDNINADAYFDLLFDEKNINDNIFIDDIIVFANAVSCTCKNIDRSNYIRINGWSGFISQSTIELASNNEQTKQKATDILTHLGWQFIWAPDVPGMITARIVSMIINEAYFALQDEISTKPEIDVAMKLGTNYPFGPFEWAEKIGIKNIYNLLTKLEHSVSLLLKKEAGETEL